MTATGHAIVGTVIATTILNPAIGIPLAILSHIVCDLFPHWDSGTHGKTKTRPRIFIEAVGDVLLGFALSYLLIHYLFPQTNIVYAFVLIICAQLFDYLTAPYFMFNWKVAPFSWFYWLQVRWNIRLDKPMGIINQIAVLILLVSIVKLY